MSFMCINSIIDFVREFPTEIPQLGYEAPKTFGNSISLCSKRKTKTRSHSDFHFEISSSYIP